MGCIGGGDDGLGIPAAVTEATPTVMFLRRLGAVVDALTSGRPLLEPCSDPHR